MNMIARMSPNKPGTIGSLLDLAEPQQRERPHPMRPEHHRIKRAELSCDVSRVYRTPGIAGLALHKCKRVVSERIIGTQTNGLIELANGAVVRVLKPQRSTDRAMCCRVAWIRLQCLSGSLNC